MNRPSISLSFPSPSPPPSELTIPPLPFFLQAVVFYETNGPIKIETAWPVTQPSELKPGEVLVRVGELAPSLSPPPSLSLVSSQSSHTFRLVLNPISICSRTAVYSGVCHTDLHAWLGDWPLENKVSSSIPLRDSENREGDGSQTTALPSSSSLLNFDLSIIVLTC